MLLGRKDGRALGQRFRTVTPDAVILIFGAALLLVWAGIIEAFVSQHHEPTIPYSLKIIFGTLELAALSFYLWRSGKKNIAPMEGKG